MTKSLHMHDKKQKTESRKAASEEVRLQTTAKNRQRGCSRIGHGSLFQNPTQNFWTQPNPTQPIIDTWYGILGYTENFIQQLLQFDYK